MLKKRVIFTLLFCNGHYMLSRNFRLQKVGDINWLKKNYKLSKITFSIDELIVLNVSRKVKDFDLFLDHITELTEECFIPIAAGGGIRNVSQAKRLLRAGADKVVLNTAIFKDPNLVYDIAKEFGQQCIVASVDVKKQNGQYRAVINNGENELSGNIEDVFEKLSKLPIGEIYLNSIEKDGTGQGYLFELIDKIKNIIDVPLIIAGGVGNYKHFIEGLNYKKVDAVATAHLFNFVGDGLKEARDKLIAENFELPVWDISKSIKLQDSLLKCK